MTTTPDARCNSLIYTGPRKWDRCGRPVKWAVPDGLVCGYHQRAWRPSVKARLPISPLRQTAS